MKLPILTLLPLSALLLLLTSCQTRRTVEQVDASTMLTPTQFRLIYNQDQLHEEASGTFSDRPQIANKQAERLLEDSMAMSQ